MSTTIRFMKGTLLLAALTSIAAYLFFNKERPVGEQGEVAEKLRQKIETAVKLKDWQETGAIQWTFSGKKLLWDRKNKKLQIDYEEMKVQLDLENKKGRIFKNGKWIKNTPEVVKWEKRAWNSWINDSFWLNPLAKMRDGGVEVSLVKDQAKEKLLVSFSSGGNTPGDAYLWTVDTEGIPTAWEMWVSIIPIGGVKTSWENWITLSTGALISTRHTTGPFTFELTEVEAAKDLSELIKKDPFIGLR